MVERPASIASEDAGFSLQSAAVPLRQRIACPQCGKDLVRKPGGRCPSCGVAVAAHVQAERAREERIERMVAVAGTVLVVTLFGVMGGAALLEGMVAYALAGAVMFYLARKSF
jgi:hypothetical protein